MKSLLVMAVLLAFSIHAAAFDKEIILHGKVLNLKTRAMIPANVEVFCNSDFAEVYSGNAQQGEFSLPLVNYGWYIISISSPGFLEKVDTLWVVSEKESPIEKEFYLAPIEVGQTITLQSVYFDSGKARLKEESYPSLDKVVGFFMENRSVMFEIGGHTDHQGSAESNLKLSQWRAHAVVEYLVSKGVNRSQLKAIGYGTAYPLETVASTEADAKNRRVEFKVLKIKSMGSPLSGE